MCHDESRSKESPWPWMWAIWTILLLSAHLDTGLTPPPMHRFIFCSPDGVLQRLSTQLSFAFITSDYIYCSFLQGHIQFLRCCPFVTFSRCFYRILLALLVLGHSDLIMFCSKHPFLIRNRASATMFPFYINSGYRCEFIMCGLV